MSIRYCQKHLRRWDSNKAEECPSCYKNYPPAPMSERERRTKSALKKAGMCILSKNVERGDYKRCPVCFGENGKHKRACYVGEALAAYEKEDGK